MRDATKAPRTAAFALAFALAAPGAVWAQAHKHDHGTPTAAHGGVVAESGDHRHWVELVVAGGRITAYVSDEANAPIPSARLGGKATVLSGGKREEVPLAPGAGNGLRGKPANPAQGRTTAVLQLTVDGKPVQARVAAP